MQRPIFRRNCRFFILSCLLLVGVWFFVSLSPRETHIEENDDKEFSDIQRAETTATLAPRLFFKFPSPNFGEDADPLTRQRRDYVKGMMKHAWDGYAKYAWGQNELKPITKTWHVNSVLGSGALGATIIDSLSTLLIMNMTKEYEAARSWVEKDLNFNVADQYLSMFEINIRLLGGLLSAYALTTDRLFLDRAVDLGERMLPAFKTSKGTPYSRVNLKTGQAEGIDPVLAEWGTLSLEFHYLADASGKEHFRQPIRGIYDAINNAENKDGIFPVHVVLRSKTTRKSMQRWKNLGHYTLGANADSFYEYLLKRWLQSGKTDEESLRLYVKAVEGTQTHLIHRSTPSNFTYLADIAYNSVEHKMGHLACFAGGMLALGGKELDNKSHVELGAELTRTCRESYEKSPVKLGPEIFIFNNEKEAGPYNSEDTRYYILRPEVVETYFILWRITHDPKYRDWGWDVVRALEDYCRVETGGYSGLVDVYAADNQLDNVQQSFFLAETLKYLYLLYSDDTLIPLGDWVFNTEAHPLPIKGKSPV